MNTQIWTESAATADETETARVAMDLFGDDINHIEGVDYFGPNYTPLFQSIYNKAFEEGMLRPQVINPPASYLGTQLEQEMRSVPPTEPARCLTRTSMIYLLEKYGPENYSYHLLDIAKLRQADLAGSADYLLSRVANVVTQNVKTMNVELAKLEGNNNPKIPCVTGRYGGDELMVAVPSGTNPEKLLAQIQAELGQIEGYYLDSQTGNTERRPVELKDGKVLTYERPETEIDMKVFKAFLSRGVFMDQAEIEKIKAGFPEFARGDYTLIDQVLKDYAWAENKIYPNELLESGKTGLELSAAKAKYIGDLYPEFQTAFNLCVALDEADIKKPGGSKRLSAALRFIEHSVFDRLLGDVFYSYQRIESGLRRDDYARLFTVDSKFLKELNAKHSYAYGDGFVVGLWSKLGSVLGEERKKFQIARRAGTFVLALNKGESLTDAGLEKLKNFRSVRVELSKGAEGEAQVIETPLGFAEMDLGDRPANSDQDEAKMKEWVAQKMKVVDVADLDFFDQSLKAPEQFLRVLIGEGTSNYEEIAHDYYHSQRSAERCQKALSRLNFANIDQELREKIRQELIKIGKIEISK